MDAVGKVLFSLCYNIVCHSYYPFCGSAAVKIPIDLIFGSFLHIYYVLSETLRGAVFTSLIIFYRILYKTQ